MKTSTWAVVSTLLSVGLAQPHHRHQALHAKRDIVIVTVDEWVTETVGYTTTIWVDADAPATEAPSTSSSSSSSVLVSTSTSSSAVAATTTTKPPAQFFQPLTTLSTPSTTSTTSTTSSSSTSEYVAPAETSTTPEPSTSTTEVPVVAAAVPEVSTTAVSVVETPTTTEAAYTPPATTTEAAASTEATTPASSSSPSSGSSDVHSGDITYYQVGLGACGWTNDGESENVVAISKDLMGTQSNGNPFCGKMVSIKLGSTTITAKVVDKCMSCAPDDLDLSNLAFSSLASFDVGRTTAEWWFN